MLPSAFLSDRLLVLVEECEAKSGGNAERAGRLFHRDCGIKDEDISDQRLGNTLEWIPAGTAYSLLNIDFYANKY